MPRAPGVMKILLLIYKRFRSILRFRRIPPEGCVSVLTIDELCILVTPESKGCYRRLTGITAVLLTLSCAVPIHGASLQVAPVLEAAEKRAHALVP